MRLVIRPEQMHILGEDRLVRNMQSERPDLCRGLDADQLSKLVSLLLSKAELYSIDTKSDLLQMFEWMIAIHPNWEHLNNGGWGLTILKQPGLSGSDKISLISQQMPKRGMTYQVLETA